MNTVFCLALFDALNMWNKSGSYFNITSVEALFTGVKCPNNNCAPAVNNIAYTVSGFDFTRQKFISISMQDRILCLLFEANFHIYFKPK